MIHVSNDGRCVLVSLSQLQFRHAVYDTTCNKITTKLDDANYENGNNVRAQSYVMNTEYEYTYSSYKEVYSYIYILSEMKNQKTHN